MDVVEIRVCWGVDTILDCASFADEGDGEAWLEDAWGRVEHLLSIEKRAVGAVRLLVPRLLDRLEYRWLNALVLVVFAHVVAVATFLAAPLGGARLTEDLFARPARFVQVELTRAVGRSAPAAAGPIGIKKRGVPKKGRPDLIASLFGDGAARRKVVGPAGLGDSLAHALDGVTGTALGSADGTGFGTRGDGPGGGGRSLDSVGIDPLGHLPANYGEHMGTLVKTKTNADIALQPPVIAGSLDKEVIRAVIRGYIPQIRYCYERILVLEPDVFGKVAIRFTIGPDGRVTDAVVTENTAHNAELARCIEKKVLGWRFPKPKGGGIVVVHYPFIMKPAG
jgi:hypothetical protein